VSRESITNPGECLSDQTLSEYLEGALDPIVRNACEVHLVACDPCREKLAFYMRMLQPELSAREETRYKDVLAVWESRNLQPVPQRKAHVAIFRQWRYGLVAIAAVLVVMVVFRKPQEPAPPTPGEIVQFILDKKRPFEPRLFNQPYRPLEVTRGAEEQLDYRPLLASMTEQSANAYEMGRFFLTQNEYRQAVAELEKAAGDPNALAGVYNDLGVAYLQRAEAGDLDRAQQQLDLSLKRDPDFAPAVFNLALLHLRRDNPGEAAKQSKRYRELDPGSQWADEIDRKLPEEFRLP
jgi:tetratricopeptide (TPR) repeat protein